MKAAIIAAGRGERLHAAGIAEPKPLVRVAGRPLIDYALGAIATAGIERVACIVNEYSTGIEEHCRQAWPQLACEFVRRTTPNSMESLFTLAPLLGEGRFALLTVDAVFAPTTLTHFLAGARQRVGADVVLGLTDFVDDEKPLWARIAPDGRVLALGDAARPCATITAGLYVFDPRVFVEIDSARTQGFTALRRFLGHLLERGYRIDAEPVGKSVDVDRREDIAVAEAFVAAGFAS